jgi:hypothetical protein
MANVTAIHRETTGTVVTGRYQMRGHQSVGGGTAGDVIYRDGGASGTIKFQFNIGSGTQPIGLTFPADGILFLTDVHVTLPTSAKTTAFVEAV